MPKMTKTMVATMWSVDAAVMVKGSTHRRKIAGVRCQRVVYRHRVLQEQMTVIRCSSESVCKVLQWYSKESTKNRK